MCGVRFEGGGMHLFVCQRYPSGNMRLKSPIIKFLSQYQKLPSCPLQVSSEAPRFKTVEARADLTVIQVTSNLQL